jgi:hypothetical protein
MDVGNVIFAMHITDDDGKWHKLAPLNHPRWEAISEHDGRWLYFRFRKCDDGQKLIFIDEDNLRFFHFVFDTFAEALHFKMKNA